MFTGCNDYVVGLHESKLHQPSHLISTEILQKGKLIAGHLHDGIHGKSACHLAGRVAPQPVGNSEQGYRAKRVIIPPYTARILISYPYPGIGPTTDTKGAFFHKMSLSGSIFLL
jgi:hypothetical protein